QLRDAHVLFTHDCEHAPSGIDGNWAGRLHHHAASLSSNGRRDASRAANSARDHETMSEPSPPYFATSARIIRAAAVFSRSEIMRFFDASLMFSPFVSGFR